MDSALSRRQIGEILRELDSAVEETRQWLSLFHRALVCGLPPHPAIVAEDAHRNSRFGRWYAASRASAGRDGDVFSQGAFLDLIGLHRDIHAHAAALALVGQQEKGPLPPAEYDALLRRIDSFHGQAGRMTRAFRAALSDLDPLTGANTRAMMEQELLREQQRMRRTGRSSCIALADIDRFKAVNDTYGHHAGDRVLSRIARMIEDALRPYDTIYRVGGEEFLICLPDSDPEQARRVLERVRGRIAATPVRIPGEMMVQEMPQEGMPPGEPPEAGVETGAGAGSGAVAETEDMSGSRAVMVTVSFGVAQLLPRRQLKEITGRADRALYEAKNTGRNRVVVWTAELA